MAILERINSLFNKGEILKLINFFEDGVICFLPPSNRDEAFQILIKELKNKGKLQDEKQFFEAILKREKIVSTGIGMGVAIPHAKLEEFNEFFIAIGIQKEGIEWDAVDKLPVKIIFLIGGPIDQQTEYLKILSSLTTAIKDEERLKKLLNVKTKEDVISLFSEC